jgi:hypothetical protein
LNSVLNLLKSKNIPGKAQQIYFKLLALCSKEFQTKIYNDLLKFSFSKL